MNTQLLGTKAQLIDKMNLVYQKILQIVEDDSVIATDQVADYEWQFIALRCSADNIIRFNSIVSEFFREEE